MYDWQDEYQWIDLSKNQRIGILLKKDIVEIIIQVDGINHHSEINIPSPKEQTK